MVKHNIIPWYKEPIPILNTQQMIEVDRLMIEKYRIELIQMMENAGRCLAILSREKLMGANDLSKKVMVLAGTGGNGGGALVAARRLSSWGFDVKVAVTNPDNMSLVADHQLTILKNMGISVLLPTELDDRESPDLIIDGIVGYSLKGAPRGEVSAFIRWAKGNKAPTVSLDTPSGVDLTSGEVYDSAIKADATLTLALPKAGLFKAHVKLIRGDLYLGDISVPPILYQSPSLGITLENNPFEKADVVRID